MVKKTQPHKTSMADLEDARFTIVEYVCSFTTKETHRSHMIFRQLITNTTPLAIHIDGDRSPRLP
jgi:hypothetical protein